MWNATSSKIRNPIAVLNNTVFSYFGQTTLSSGFCLSCSQYRCNGCAAVYSLNLVTNTASEIFVQSAGGSLALARRIVAQPGRLLFLGGRDVSQSTVGLNYHVETVHQLTLSNGELNSGSSTVVMPQASGGKPIWESTAATAVGDKFVFFGGQFGGHEESSSLAPFEVGLHAYDLSIKQSSYVPVAWYSRGANDNSGVSGATPSPREDPAMTVISQSVILVHGGYSYSIPDCPCGSALAASDCVSNVHVGHLLNDFWMFDTQANKWFSLPASTTPTYGPTVAPEPRNQHGMVSIGDNAFLFGGRTSLPYSVCEHDCVIDQTDSLYSFNMITRYDEILR